MDKKTVFYESELSALPPLRFILIGSENHNRKDVKHLTPVHKPGEEMEINVRKLIAHLTETK